MADWRSVSAKGHPAGRRRTQWQTEYITVRRRVQRSRDAPTSGEHKAHIAYATESIVALIKTDVEKNIFSKTHRKYVLSSDEENEADGDHSTGPLVD